MDRDRPVRMVFFIFDPSFIAMKTTQVIGFNEESGISSRLPRLVMREMKEIFR